jgi:hypothetical protein
MLISKIEIFDENSSTSVITERSLLKTIDIKDSLRMN